MPSHTFCYEEQLEPHVVSLPAWARAIKLMMKRLSEVIKDLDVFVIKDLIGHEDSRAMDYIQLCFLNCA